MAAFLSVLDLPGALEALAAVDRPVVLGNEGDLGGRAALSADRVIHLTGGAAIATTTIALTLAGVAAVLAADGLVGKAFLGIEFLLTSGEHEILSTIPTP